MFRKLLLAFALLLPSVAQAQLCIWIPTSGDQGVGIAIGADGKAVVFTKLITVSPTPVPPGPGPAPINAVGLYCLVVEDMQQRDDLPASQREVITATGPGSLRAYLNFKCAKDQAGMPCLRFIGSKDDLSRDLPVWREGLARPRTSLPWIVISNGKSGYEGPLPKTMAEAVALAKKFGETSP